MSADAIRLYKWGLSLSLLWLLCISSSGQIADYSAPDKHALKVKKNNTGSVEDLASFLAPPKFSDVQKVRSFYTWIIHHILYDKGAMARGDYSYNHFPEKILSRRRAVCTGYATLFEALCEFNNIPSVVISGYSRGTPTSSLAMEAPDHAWNAVFIDTSWYLLDLTWAAGLFGQLDGWNNRTNDRYFLTPPDQFITDHFPSMPMWQLLDCPWSIKKFKRNSYNQPSVDADCITYKDSIDQFMALTPRKRKVKEAFVQNSVNPTATNQRELGHSYLDYAAMLVDSTEQYVLAGDIDTLMHLQKEVIDYCKKAESLTDFYTWQREMYAHTLLNYVASRFNNFGKIAEEPQKFYNSLLSDLESAHRILADTEPTFFVQSALKQYEVFREMINGYIEKR